MTVRTKQVCSVKGCGNRLWSHHVRFGYTKCSLHQIEEQGTVHTELPAAIPAHFNMGTGEYYEGRDDWKRRMKELKRDGVIEGHE